MQDSLSTASLRFAMKFPFQSKDWVGRFVIGVALLFAGMMIPIIPPVFVYGYIVEVMRRAIKGELNELPEWKDWGKYGMDGLRSLAVGAVYLGPGFLVGFFGWLVYMGAYFGGIAMMTASPHQQLSGPMVALMFGSIGVLFLSMIFSSLLCLAGAIPLPAAMAHFIANDKVNAAFHVREWNKILRADKWGYFIGWLLLIGLMGVMYFAFTILYLTLILCFLGFFVMMPIGFYALLVSAAVFGQIYRESASRLELKTVEKTTAEVLEAS